MRTGEIVVILHNVRSAHNVGSVFRTADAAGVSRIYLTGYTPLPVDQFGRVQKEIAKTALGAETTVSWQAYAQPREALSHLRAKGYRIVGVEQDARSKDYRTFAPGEKMAFIFGNEVRGLSHALHAQCDELIEIPMHGTKESLNVAVAAGIVLFNTQKR